jgi:hypothetical protein
MYQSLSIIIHMMSSSNAPKPLLFRDLQKCLHSQNPTSRLNRKPILPPKPRNIDPPTKNLNPQFLRRIDNKPLIPVRFCSAQSMINMPNPDLTFQRTLILQSPQYLQKCNRISSPRNRNQHRVPIAKKLQRPDKLKNTLFKTIKHKTVKLPTCDSKKTGLRDSPAGPYQKTFFQLRS